MNEIHEIECEDQPEDSPCICEQIQERRQQDYDDNLIERELEEREMDKELAE